MRRVLLRVADLLSGLDNLEGLCDNVPNGHNIYVTALCLLSMGILYGIWQERGALMAVTTPGRYYDDSSTASAAPSIGYTGGCYPTESHGNCSRNTHHFECKHARRCYCGMTARLPLEVDEGL